ncbi:MAG: hypothetical protein ACI4BD_02460 [Paludibacteraceae bacterium]
MGSSWWVVGSGQTRATLALPSRYPCATPVLPSRYLALPRAILVQPPAYM